MKTLARLLRILRVHRPHNAAEARKMGIRLRHVGEGAFRQTYKVFGLPIVLKFPIGDDDDEFVNRQHNLREFKAHARIMSTTRLQPLRRYLPQIWYCDPTGYVMVMQYYPRVATGKTSAFAVLNNLVNDLGMVDGTDADVHSGNARLDKRGNIKFVDLGLFKS